MPAPRQGGAVGDHAESGVGHRGEQVRRPRRSRRRQRRVRGLREQEVRGGPPPATAPGSARPRPCAVGPRASTCPAVPGSPARDVPASGRAGGSVAGAGIERDGGKAAWGRRGGPVGVRDRGALHADPRLLHLVRLVVPVSCLCRTLHPGYVSTPVSRRTGSGWGVSFHPAQSWTPAHTVTKLTVFCKVPGGAHSTVTARF